MTRKNDAIGRRLKEEAEMPEFSEELHVRVMGDVRRGRIAETERRRGWMWAMGAAAAGVAVMAGVWMFKAEKNEEAKGMEALVLPKMPSIEEVMRETAGPVREKLKDARYAYLDRDGKRLAMFLWKSVPGVSALENAGKESEGERKEGT